MNKLATIKRALDEGRGIQRQTFGGIPAYGAQKGSPRWRYAFVQNDKGERSLRLMVGDKTMSWNLAQPGENPAELGATREADANGNGIPDHLEVISQGAAQVHKSGPAEIHATMQDGRIGATFRLLREGGDKWKMHLKAPKQPVENTALQFVTTLKEKTAALSKEAGHHHERKTCTGCGNVSTCRCSAPKIDVKMDPKDCFSCQRAAEKAAAMNSGRCKNCGEDCPPWQKDCDKCDQKQGVSKFTRQRRRRSKDIAAVKTEPKLAMLSKIAERRLISYVRPNALDSVRRHGLLSADLLSKPENRPLLEISRPGVEAERWLEEHQHNREERPWSDSYLGPSVLFGPPDPEKLNKNHPIVKGNMVPISIRLDQLMAEQPDTRVHGSELVPYNTEHDAAQPDYPHQRHHDLDKRELSKLMRLAKTPNVLWKDYQDTRGKTYAANVPHAQIITPTNRIDPHLIDFPESPTPKLAALSKVAHVLITGPSGAGKSTLAAQLSKEKGMPILNLDKEPEWGPWVKQNDPQRLPDGTPIHVAPGTPSNLEWKKLMRVLAQRGIATETPHIIEGTQLMTLKPKELRGHELHLVNPPLEQVQKQRIARSNSNRAKDGREPQTPEEEERNRHLAAALYNSIQPAVKKWNAMQPSKLALLSKFATLVPNYDGSLWYKPYGALHDRSPEGQAALDAATAPASTDRSVLERLGMLAALPSFGAIVGAPIGVATGLSLDGIGNLLETEGSKHRAPLRNRIKEYASSGALMGGAMGLIKSIPEAIKTADDQGLRDRIAKAEGQTDTNPSEAQKESENYRKGKVTIHGLTVAIENPKGSTRKGVSKSGKAWETTMANSYGYILKHVSEADGDHVDVFLGDHPESELVFVVDQVSPESGRFDEHKVLMGFTNESDARSGYLNNYDKSWKGLGDITSLTIEQFRGWLKKGDTSKPLKGQALAGFAKKASIFKPWVGVDLDGTLAFMPEGIKGIPFIGKPIPKMLARVKEMLAEGKTVKIFTARAYDKKNIPAVKKWLKTHGLPNLAVTNVKDPGMTQLLDDRAVAIHRNQGTSKHARLDLLAKQAGVMDVLSYPLTGDSTLGSTVAGAAVGAGLGAGAHYFRKTKRFLTGKDQDEYDTLGDSALMGGLAGGTTSLIVRGMREASGGYRPIQQPGVNHDTGLPNYKGTIGRGAGVDVNSSAGKAELLKQHLEVPEVRTPGLQQNLKDMQDRVADEAHLKGIKLAAADPEMILHQIASDYNLSHYDRTRLMAMVEQATKAGIPMDAQHLSNAGLGALAGWIAAKLGGFGGFGQTIAAGLGAAYGYGSTNPSPFRDQGGWYS